MVILLFLGLASFAAALEPTVSPAMPFNISFTYQGQSVTVQGLDHGLGKNFLGIPFGQPPVGNLRFKPAVPVPLSGFYNATVQMPWCAQHKKGTVEDCLYLNVWTPSNISANSNYPVYVYFFGGGFHEGGPTVPGDGAGAYINVINRGPVVVVLPNYRIGPFGFFSTRDNAIPGNAAMTDWIATLQWVQSYIRFFGGDPTKVTIGGASAGSMAVSFLTMSRKADNLFRAGVMESGSSMMPSFMSYADEKRNTSMVVAVATGCATVDQWMQHDPAENQKILNCLLTKSVDDIMTADNAIPEYDGSRWGLVQDNDLLPGKLETLALQRRPIPMIIGTQNLEWLFYMKDTITKGNLSVVDKDYVINRLQGSFGIMQFENPDQVYQQTVAMYIDSQNTSADDHTGWCRNHMDMWTEMAFTGPSFKDAKYFAYTGSKTYVYIFAEVPLLESVLIPDPRLRGAFHSLQLNYIYDEDLESDEPNQPDSDLYPVTQIMGKMWTNFIVTGNPTPTSGGSDLGFTWDALGATDNYLYITKQPMMAQGYIPRAQYWVCNVTVDGVIPPFC